MKMKLENINPDWSNKTNASDPTKLTVTTAATAKETATSLREPSKPIARPPYSALRPHQRRLFLGIVATAGFFGPLAAGIYLPAIPTLQAAFHTSATAINATVSVFMAVLAVGVSYISVFIATPTSWYFQDVRGVKFG